MRDRFITRTVHNSRGDRFVGLPDRRWDGPVGCSSQRPWSGCSPGCPSRGTPKPFLAQFGSGIGITPATEVGSTVPSNGEVNPYSLVEAAQSIGRLVAGDALVSNFNNSSNQHGTGTTLSAALVWRGPKWRRDVDRREL
jgi:hypothetical protein